jgi:asparagine synthase (glutamine-hydrolysing)
MDGVPADLRALREGLDSALAEALRPARTAPGALGVLFSGGVDSALLAWELRGRPSVTLYTLGRTVSSDLPAGKAGAERLGLPWEGLPVDRDEVRAAERRFSQELIGIAEVSRRVLLALGIAIAKAGSRRLVCGQGVDELFLGYAHYRGLSPEEAEQRSHEDLHRLHESDWPRTLRIAEKCGKEILAPYLHPRFEEQALRVPIDLRRPRDVPKRFFREWAVERGLPRELAERPKKAVQYGSGVDALVRAMRRPAR